MKLAIQKHFRDFIAIIVLIVIAAAVGGYILSNQRFYLPAWFPGIGSDFFTLNAEFDTAKSVTPGQGQTLTIAGVDVGEISKVTLVDGRARIEFKVRPKYAKKIRSDATMLLRPKTGLEDMTVELSPGTSRGRKVREGWTVPIENTLPDVKFEEILASLDRDTRDYVQLLIAGLGEGLNGRGKDLAATFKRFEPGARDLRAITGELEDRRKNIKASIGNLRKLVEAVGEKDTQLAELLDSSNAVFKAFANQDASLRSALQQLPSTLDETNSALVRVDDLATDLGPALRDLTPGARALGPTLRQMRPFLRETTPVIKDELRPFARETLPTIKALRPAARDLAEVGPDLTESFKVVNYLFNELAYNPPGKAEEGYLFWVSWANHLGTLLFGSQDAHGPLRRGSVYLDCASAGVLDTIVSADPRLGTIAQLSGVPRRSETCPRSTAASTTATASNAKAEGK